ncbi:MULTISPECIES: hypothetical protein [unclassified Pseudomonas]|uniref:hypothetical protein n=1 Tax=unclassified Pseudomonas TaxID=196821 RepID=UPI000A1F7495|nr:MULTISPECIES: hypothetical protein [unclassified Pseudomonas]
MSQALKEQASEKYQGQVKTFTIFKQNGISLTLDLPGTLQFNQNSQEIYPPLSGSVLSVAPVLVNETGFDIVSATFSVVLNDVLDATNVIANVRWWNMDLLEGQQTMEFVCGPVSNGNKVTSTPSTIGYSRIRWATMANNGHGTASFSNSVSLVSLTFGPIKLDPSKTSPGPIVQIG